MRFEHDKGLIKGRSRHKNWCMARVLSYLIRNFSNYYTLHHSDLAARAAPLDPRLPMGKFKNKDIKKRFLISFKNMHRHKKYIYIAYFWVGLWNSCFDLLWSMTHLTTVKFTKHHKHIFLERFLHVLKKSCVYTKGGSRHKDICVVEIFIALIKGFLGMT